MMKQMAAAILVLTLAGLGTARADDDCHVPMERWQPREAVQTMAAGRGWTVTRIKIDDGCYEIRGTDEGGRPFKAKIDPATLEIVKLRYFTGLEHAEIAQVLGVSEPTVRRHWAYARSWLYAELKPKAPIV